ncbi:MAG: 26S protease regulatory subunit [Myxococcales bacterium]|nr:26S protease regulatory subunit [Myxococcales bacterium]
MTDASDGLGQRMLRQATRAIRDAIVAETKQKEPTYFAKRLGEHFGREALFLPIVGDSVASRDHMNIQVAVEALLASNERSFELVGVSRTMMGGTDIATLLQSAPGFGGFGAPTQGPVQYTRFDLPDGSTVSAVENGLYLVRSPSETFALYVAVPGEMQRYLSIVSVQVMAERAETAERIISELRALTREKNMYRGRVVSLEVSDREVVVRFHALPKVDRSQIILPEGLLDRIERQTVRFSQHADKLRAMGRHIKRGVLLHGPPGTGKTFTAMHLASCMPDRTTVLVTGRGQGLLQQSCQLAKMLQPATVIIEDVDLIAEERSSANACNVPLLFELLNEMDGLSGDSDVLFVLTTNRPEILEPALAARPGRIDQAIEIALPDEDCRRRLIALYSEGMPTRIDALAEVVARTEGASGAFIKELLRKAALVAVDRGGDEVTDDDVRASMHELLVDGGPLTKALLGARTRASAE